MEFVSGYRDEFLDFAALLFGWFRKFVTEKGTMGTNLEGRWRQLEAQIRRLPQDPALWVLHVLPNRSVGISLGQEAAPLHLSCLLLVTDEHGTILGIDLLMDGTQGSVGQSPGTENLAPRAYALLCHSMACPMGSGDPRKPRQLTVGDAHLHRDLESLVPRLGVKLAKTPMRTWGPRPGFTFASLRARTCHVCHKHSFEVKLTPCGFPTPLLAHRMALRFLCVLVLGYQHGSALGLRRREGEGICKSGCLPGPITCSRDPSLTWLLDWDRPPLNCSTDLGSTSPASWSLLGLYLSGRVRLGIYLGEGASQGVSEGLPKPQSLRVPAFFTESSEYGCVMDDQTMAVATGGGTSSPQPNPFRSPFRLRAADNCMPCPKSLRALASPARRPGPASDHALAAGTATPSSSIWSTSLPKAARFAQPPALHLDPQLRLLLLSPLEGAEEKRKLRAGPAAADECGVGSLAAVHSLPKHAS
ncbi:hypothetical protein NN561_004032 [Cricetulus griseus]